MTDISYVALPLTNSVCGLISRWDDRYYGGVNPDAVLRLWFDFEMG